MSTPPVEVTGLHRVYRTSTGLVRRRRKDIAALRGVDFQVEPAEIFGLVGPNGAGKTTLIKILTTLLLPSAGSARVLGLDVATEHRRIRPRINFLFGGERGLYWRLSAEDNLRYFADLYHLPPADAKPRVGELLDLVGLTERRQERVEGFSRGMKQRLHIAKALLNRPEVVFLDEPTIGLDPVAARSLRELIRLIRDQGTTVVLTSHYMWEMGYLCDRLAVLDLGEIRFLDAPNALLRRVAGTHVVELAVPDGAGDLAAVGSALEASGRVTVSEAGGRQTIRVHTSAPEQVLGALGAGTLAAFTRAAAVVREAQLEDAYVLMVGGRE